MFTTIFPTIISSVIAAILAWLAGRGQMKAQISKLNIENVADVVAIYKTAIDDLRKEVNELKLEIHALREKLRGGSIPSIQSK